MRQTLPSGNKLFDKLYEGAVMKPGTLSKLMLGGLLAVGVGALAPSAYALPSNQNTLLTNYVNVQIITASQTGSIVSIAEGTTYYIGIDPSGTTIFSTSAFTGALFGLDAINVTDGPAFPSTPPSAYSSASALDVTGLSPVTLSDTLNIFTGAAGFNVPSVPPIALLTNQLSPTSATTSSGDLIKTYGCATDTSVNDCLGTGVLTPTSTITDTMISNLQGNSSSALVSSLPTSYTLGNVSSVSLNYKDAVNFTVSTKLQTVPEPFSMSLMAVGLLGLTIVYRRRSRA